MFKKSNADAAPAVYERTEPMQKRATAASRSVLGPTLIFKGELSSDEDLIIEGRIEGSIHHQNKDLTIGKSGSVKANINARVITIEGKVDGDLVGDEAVILKGTARVIGNITGPRVIFEDGAQFNGKVDMNSPKPGSAEGVTNYNRDMTKAS